MILRPKPGECRYASSRYSWTLEPTLSNSPSTTINALVVDPSSSSSTTATSSSELTNEVVVLQHASMATPSSSGTSPSPPMAYLHHVPAAQQPFQNNLSDTLERDQRKKAVEKFLARAEISMVTRRLRAQLAYASYKATHNISHVSFRDLEAQMQSQTSSFSRTIAAKRKAAAASYSSPSIHGSAVGAGSLRRGGSNSMAPPTSTLSPRLYPTSVTSTSNHSGWGDVASSHRNTSQAPNLYASILAPPASKLARTIHNPNDPPVPAPERPTHTPKSSRASKSSPRNDPSRPSKTKQSGKAKETSSPDRRRKKPASSGKRKVKRRTDAMDVDGEMDMQAAATLTSLLLHNRPSIAGATSSPRSSIDGSEAGSVYSYTQYHQSSARTSSQLAPPISAAPSVSTLVAESSFRTATPPPSGTHTLTPPHPVTTAPTDSEAANLMLYLATSPSPVRPTTTNKESKDAAAYRILGGPPGPLRTKGRVLFPSNAATDRIVEPQDSSIPSIGSPLRALPLARGTENSFSSSISSIGPELGGSNPSTELVSSQPSVTVVGSPFLTPSTSTSQLLPSAPLPLPTAPGSPAGRKEDRYLNPSPKPSPGGIQAGAGAIVNPSLGSANLEFNIHDFINASPLTPAPTSRANIGLRADVGRKLFEEEQMKHLYPSGTPRHEERTLGAGIDLVRS